MFAITKINTKQVLGIITCFSFVCLIFFFTLYDVFAFNFETYLNKQYTLIFWLPILALQIICLFKNKKAFNHRLLIELLLIAIFASLLCFSSYYTFTNEYFFTLLVIGLSCYSLYSSGHLRIFKIILLSFLLIFYYQLYLGIEQSFYSISDDGLSITGSLQNSGVYAYYLVFNLPFFYWFCFQNPYYLNQLYKLFYKILFLIILIMVIYLIYSTKSRTAFICLALTTGYYLFYNYKHKILAFSRSLPKSVLLIVTILSVGIPITLGLWLFNLKRLSAMGRLLNMHVFSENIGDYLWFGTGLGRFTWYYPQWQANYFKAHPDPKLEFFFSADESYIIFNEYLQLFGTIGIVGFLICSYIFYLFFSLKTKEENNLLLTIKSTVAVILLGCFTSYPLHVNIILLMLGACLVVGFSLASISNFKSVSKTWLFCYKIAITVCFFLVCIASYRGYTFYCAASQWQISRNLNSAEARSNYKKLYPVLNFDGKFLTEYGEAFLVDNTPELIAIQALEKAKKLSITRRGVEALVFAYVNVKKYDLAILNQEFLVNYMPNKFIPRYNLLQLHVLQNDTANIKKVGISILEMRVKKRSFEVGQIKLNTLDILKKYE